MSPRALGGRGLGRAPRLPGLQLVDVLVQESREVCGTALEQGGGLGGQELQRTHHLALSGFQRGQLSEILHTLPAQDGVVDAGAWERGEELRTGDEVPDPAPFHLPLALKKGALLQTLSRPLPRFTGHDNNPADAAPSAWALHKGGPSPAMDRSPKQMGTQGRLLPRRLTCGTPFSTRSISLTFASGLTSRMLRATKRGRRFLYLDWDSMGLTIWGRQLSKRSFSPVPALIHHPPPTTARGSAPAALSLPRSGQT